MYGRRGEEVVESLDFSNREVRSRQLKHVVTRVGLGRALPDASSRRCRDRELQNFKLDAMQD